MRFCQPHWKALREAIDKRRLGDFISDSPSEVANEMRVQLEGKENPDSPYDPLMGATNMVYGRAIELGGLYLLQGDLCPVCEAVKHGSTESYWIDGPADAILKDFREHGWVK